MNKNKFDMVVVKDMVFVVNKIINGWDIDSDSAKYSIKIKADDLEQVTRLKKVVHYLYNEDQPFIKLLDNSQNKIVAVDYIGFDIKYPFQEVISEQEITLICKEVKSIKV